MHPIIIRFMTKERIKDLSAELERGRRINPARGKKPAKGGDDRKKGPRVWWFASWIRSYKKSWK